MVSAAPAVNAAAHHPHTRRVRRAARARDQGVERRPKRHQAVEGLREEQRRHPDERLAALHEELAGYVPPPAPPGSGAGQGADAEALLGFTVPMELESVGRGPLRLMTTVAVFSTAVDVTVAELKPEAFLPADRATADALREDA